MDPKTAMSDSELYADDADDQKPAAKSDDGKEMDDAQEAIIPKSAFGGKDLEIGHKCMFEVTGIHDNEVTVKYSPEGEDKSETEPHEKADVPSGMSDSAGSDYD